VPKLKLTSTGKLILT